MADPTPGTTPDGQVAPDSNVELTEYKQFFGGISPLLEKLDKNPDLVQAILGDKIDAAFAKAALDGTLTVKEAQAASQAVAEVKQEVGAAAAASMTPEAFSKLVEDKMAALESKLTEKDSMRDFETYTNGFIASTPDFEKYSGAISTWLDEHDVTDIRVAYYAVKGELSEKEAKAAADVAAAENAKNVLLNAGGSGVRADTMINGVPLVDTLIASHSNANHL